MNVPIFAERSPLFKFHLDAMLGFDRATRGWFCDRVRQIRDFANDAAVDVGRR